MRHEPKVFGCHAFAWGNREQLADYAFPAADEQLLEQLANSPDLWR